MESVLQNVGNDVHSFTSLKIEIFIVTAGDIKCHVLKLICNICAYVLSCKSKSSHLSQLIRKRVLPLLCKEIYMHEYILIVISQTVLSLLKEVAP